jgi:hypothetical protein
MYAPVRQISGTLSPAGISVRFELNIGSDKPEGELVDRSGICAYI